MMTSLTSPSVSGISPREGSPGTKLTVRGERLGLNASDILHVWVGTFDVVCTAQWYSSKKITILSPLGEGIIHIIVETKSGGVGSCEVDYFQTVSSNVGLQEQVSYWPPNEQKQYQVLSSYSKRIQPKQIQSEMMEDIKDVMHGNQNTPMGFSLSDEDLYKIYKGRGSTALTEPDFNPVLFLLKYHHSTDYKELARLLEHYKTALATEKVKEPISIVKANLYTIFQCLDCLEALKNKIDEEKTMIRPMSGAFAENELCRALEESKNIAHHMYEEVLKRRDYADSARSALSVMQRFRFLFNLPRSIRENISKGEYSLVINDYLRARSLFGNSEIRLFQQVYKDVVDVIDKFKEMLRRQLLEMPNKCDSVKVTIRLMRQLEVEYDPTRVCLDNQKEWILQSINKLNATSFAASPGYKPRLDKSASNSSKHPVVLMIEQINKLLSEKFHETWSLACYYLELESSNKSDVATEPAEERQMYIEELVHVVVYTYSSKVRESLVQSNLTPGWLVYCLQQVKQAIEALSLEDLPKTSTIVLVSLLEEIRVRAVRALLVRAEQDIAGLSFKENWSAEINDKVGATTRLPALYRNLMMNSLSEVSRVINSRHAMEKPLCSSAVDETAFVGWVDSAMKAYVTCADNILEKLKNRPQETSQTTEPSSVDHSVDSSLSNINVSRLLLLMANNCLHCVLHMVPSIMDHMAQLGMTTDTRERITKDVVPSLEGLHRRLVTVYVDTRLETLLGPIECEMYAAGYDWKDVYPATFGARGYVHEILAGLAQAHSEIELICPRVSRECMLRLAVKAVEEIHRVVESSGRDSWSRRGHMQLTVDMRTLETVLSVLGNKSSSKVWQEALSLINLMCGAYRLSSDELAVIKTSVEQEKKTLSLLIEGFQETGL